MTKNQKPLLQQNQMIRCPDWTGMFSNIGQKKSVVLLNVWEEEVGRVLAILRAGEPKSQVSQDIKSQTEGFSTCQRKLIIKINTNSRKSADGLEIFRLQLCKCKKTTEMLAARKLQK